MDGRLLLRGDGVEAHGAPMISPRLIALGGARRPDAVTVCAEAGVPVSPSSPARASARDSRSADRSSCRPRGLRPAAGWSVGNEPSGRRSLSSSCTVSKALYHVDRFRANQTIVRVKRELVASGPIDY